MPFTPDDTSPDILLGARFDTLTAWGRLAAVSLARRLGTQLTPDDHIALLTHDTEHVGTPENASQRYVRDVVRPLVERGRLAADHTMHWGRRLERPDADQRDADPRVSAWATAKDAAHMALLLHMDSERLHIARFNEAPFDTIQAAAYLTDASRFAYRQHTLDRTDAPYFLWFRSRETLRQGARDTIASNLLLALRVPATIARLFHLSLEEVQGLAGWAAERPSESRNALQHLLRIYQISHATLATTVVHDADDDALARIVSDGLAGETRCTETAAGVIVSIEWLSLEQLRGADLVDDRAPDHGDEEGDRDDPDDYAPWQPPTH